MLLYAVLGEEPACSFPGEQAVTVFHWRASLELYGYRLTAQDDGSMPSRVERDGRRVAVGCFPGLINTPALSHPVASVVGVMDA